MVLRSSRRSNAVSRNNFSCAVRERHHVCKNFGCGQLPGLPVPGCGPEWLHTKTLLRRRVEVSYREFFD